MAPWGSMGLTGREDLTDLGAMDRRLPRIRIIPAIIIGAGGKTQAKNRQSKKKGQGMRVPCPLFLSVRRTFGMPARMTVTAGAGYARMRAVKKRGQGSANPDLLKILIAVPNSDLSAYLSYHIWGQRSRRHHDKRMCFDAGTAREEI